MEVKAADSKCLGLFATKPYKLGDVIVEETLPLATLSPTTATDLQSIRSIWKPNITNPKSEAAPSLWESINVPSMVSSSLHGKFKGMVQAALCYLLATERSEIDAELLLKLYHPSSTKPPKHEHGIVDLSSQALEYLKGSLDEKHAAKLDEKECATLRKVMLIWSCNSFDGGRIYDTTSRINHSCDPNSVVVVGTSPQNGLDATSATESNAQKVVAASTIAVGDEITISYLSLTTGLYADTSTRRAELETSKHFVCCCERCRGEGKDPASWIPCPQCHPRVGSHHQLDEDVQYDDDQEVQYVSMATRDSDHVSSACPKCSHNVDPNGEHRGLFTVNQSVIRKAVDCLRDYRTGGNGDDNEDAEAAQEVQRELVQQQLQICSSVLGARHWTTNILMLLHLDDRLQNLHGSMLQEATAKAANKEDESSFLEQIAECIDLLERLYRFFDGLGLRLAVAHALADVTLGVSRALVSLGDPKSRAYGAQWMAKVDDAHLEHFAGPGLLAVGRALRKAGETESSPKKKARHA